MNCEDIVRIFDGKNTIGGTKILLCEKGHGLLLDFGLNYTLYGQFFEEYMKPRPVVGLWDLWQLRMIPPYPNLYRPELMLGTFPDAQELPVKEVDGLVLSHAHMDHVGLAGTLNLNIPIISSATSLAILRAHQDSGRTDFYQDAAYCDPLEACSCRTHQIIRTLDYHRHPHKGRSAIVMEGNLSKELQELWQHRANPDNAGRDMESGPIEILDKSSLNWEIQAFPVDHSIPGACATIIKLEERVVAYTGDLRFSGSKTAASKEFIKQAKKLNTSILITEGTQITRQNQCSTTEKACRDNCEETVDEAKGHLVIADFSPKNVERLIAFLKIAEKTGRRLVILPKDAYLLYCLQKVEKETPTPSESLLVYDTPKGEERHWEQWVYDTYKDFLAAAPQISSALGEYIVAFSFLDMKFLNDIKPDGGLYIFSSSEPYTEEQVIDFKRLYHWLSFYGFTMKGLTFEKVENEEDPKPKIEIGYHCSGHATPEELEMMIQEIEPEILIPVHTANSEWFKSKFGSKCKVI